MTDFPTSSHLNKVRAKLPPLLENIAALSMDQLGSAVVKMLNAVDDHFFDLAEEAKSNEQQNIYFEAMRDMRIGRRGVEQSFKQNLENGFLSMCFSSASEKDGKEALPVLVSDEANDLEEVISRISRKFRAVSAAELYKATVRFDAISDDYHVIEGNNALASQNLCEYFSRACQLVSLDINSRKILFKLFDRYVIRILPSLLVEVNARLSDAGILPEFSEQLSSSMNEPLNNEMNVAEQAAAGSEENAQSFTHLQTLLANGASNVSNAEEGEEEGRLLSKQELLEILSSLQRNIQLSNGLDANISGVNIRKQVYNILEQRQDQYSGNILAKKDGDIITLVEKLFNAILEDGSLSGLVKASLSRLQIPLVKLGLIDSTLFTEREHVGRCLVNELAKLGGRDKNKSEMARSVLYTKIEEVSQRIVREFDEDVSVFKDQYNDLMLFYSRTLSRADEMEQRSRVAVDGQEKVELARSVISQNIDLLTKDKFIPTVVDQILTGGWSDILLVTLLKEGVPGEDWNDYILTAEELIWSVQSEKDSAARQRLLQLVPHLLGKLQEGLAIINFEPFALSEILKDLEQAHLAVFGMEKETVSEFESIPQVDVSVERFTQVLSEEPEALITGDIAAITRQIIYKSESGKRNDEVGQSVDASGGAPLDQKASINATVDAPHDDLPPATPSTHEAESIVDKLNLGVWFEVHSKEGKGKYRCKLAAHLTGYNRYIFVNRRGEKVMERSRDNLVDAITAGEMVLMQETQLFDRALQSVVSDLRNAK